MQLLEKLGFIGETPEPEWPPVLPSVLEELKRARRTLTETGFKVIGDPLNPLGDGRSWVLRCKPTPDLPNNADLASLADRCLLSEGFKVAVKPVWDRGTLLVALWDSGRVETSQVKQADSNYTDKKRQDTKAGLRRLLRFKARGDQITVVPCDDMKSRIANTFDDFTPNMRAVKSIVRSCGGKITVGVLRRKFKDHHFVNALTDSDWQLLIDEFSTKRPAGIKNLTVALLARRTGLSIQTVTTYTKPSKRHTGNLPTRKSRIIPVNPLLSPSRQK